MPKIKRRYYTRSSGRNDATGGNTELEESQATNRKRIRVRSSYVEEPNPSSSDTEDDFALSYYTKEVSSNDSNVEQEEANATAVTVDSLPDTILVKIFEMLNLATRIRIERVSRRWSFVARNYSWSSTSQLDYITVADGYQFGVVGGFSIQSEDSDSDDELILHQRVRPHICRAVLQRQRLTNESMRQLLDRGGSYLTTIDLSGYRDVIDYRVLRYVGQQCPNLEVINLTGILVTNTSLLSLATGCRRLKSIIIQRCFHDSIIDRGLRSLLVNCEELVSLNVSENEKVTGTCFDRLPNTLRHLDVSACYALRDEALRAVADRCHSLERLHMDSCDRLSMQSLAYAFNRLTELRVLRMSEFYAFADSPSPPTVSAMQAISKLSNLTALYMNNNYLIDDTVICAVARGCPLLETVDISGRNKGLTDHSLISLGRFAHPTLKRLNLNNLSGITDVGIEALAQCSKLQILSLHRCDAIGDDGLIELSKNCHRLRQLDVSFCPNVTNATVLAFGEELARHNQELQSGEISFARESEADGSDESQEREIQSGMFAAPNGGIIIFVGATMVENSLPGNQFVKLNFRDALCYWSSRFWD